MLLKHVQNENDIADLIDDPAIGHNLSKTLCLGL